MTVPAEAGIEVPFPACPPEEVRHLTSELVARVSHAKGPRCRLVDPWKSILEQCVAFIEREGRPGLAGWVLLQTIELCLDGDLFSEVEGSSLSLACARHLIDLGLEPPEEEDLAPRAREAERLLQGVSQGVGTPVGAGSLGNLLSLRSEVGPRKRRTRRPSDT